MRPDFTKLYTLKEVMEILRVRKSKLYLLLNYGKLRAVKADGMTFITHDDLLTYMETFTDYVPGKDREPTRPNKPAQGEQADA